MTGEAHPSKSGTPRGFEILVARPDRIGDVILSTPVLEVLKNSYPRSRITLMVRENIAPLVRGLPSVDEVLIFDPEGTHAGLRGLFRLIDEFTRREFRIAVVLQSHWKIAAALFGAGVRHRVGPLSRLHSFLFYNRGVRQRRSQVEMHETDYNLQLLRRLGIRVPTRTIPIQVSVSEESRAGIAQLLEKRGWADDRQPRIAIHPGMGGSALNWPEKHYIELIRSLVADGRRVILSFGPMDRPVRSRILEALGELKSEVLIHEAAADTPVDRLAALFERCDLVVAPSTGPLHMAVAMGCRVVCFYPPVRVQSAIRWGPYLSDESRASVLVPEVYCGQDFKCRGNLCHYHPCMNSLVVDQALEEVNRHLEARDTART